MSRSEAPPITRGSYEETAGAFDNLLGKEWVFEDLDYSTRGARAARTNRLVTCRLVKNSSGAAILPRSLCQFKTGNGPDYGAIVAGQTTTTAQHGYPADEWLPSTGVPDGAYFWIVVRGPATVLTPMAGAEFNGNITEGTVMVALTAATTGATTAGRVAVQNITGSSQATDYSSLLNQAENMVGRALSAKTTGNTNSSLLVEVGKF